MLAPAARMASPVLADQLAARTAAFHKAMATDRASAVQAAAQLSQTVAALKSTFASRSFSGTDAFAMVDAISSKAISDRYTDSSGSQDRESVVKGKSAAVRVDRGGSRIIKKKKK